MLRRKNRWTNTEHVAGETKLVYLGVSSTDACWCESKILWDRKKIKLTELYLKVGWLLLYYVDGARANKDRCLYKRRQNTTTTKNVTYTYVCVLQLPCVVPVHVS